MKALIRYIVRKQLRNMKAKSQDQFLDMVCNTFNDGQNFW